MQDVTSPLGVLGFAMTPFGVLVDTLGKTELEAAAAALVRYHVASDLTEWTPVSARAFFEWLPKDEVILAWARNPFWRPDFHGLIQKGFFVGWAPGEPDSIGNVTEKMLAAFRSAAEKRAKRAVERAKGGE